MSDDGTDEDVKIGVLADRTGLTVRTLHHYDRLGLLRPSGRTWAGHRLYSAVDVERLYRIAALRRLGLSLAEIGAALDDPDWPLREAVRRHLDDTARRIATSLALQRRLSTLADQLDHSTSPSTDDLLTILEEMTMLNDTIHGTTALLVYNDLAAAQDYLVRVFGLTATSLDRDEAGTPRHAEVRAGDQVLWLHPSGDGFRSPADVGAATGMTVISVDDADAHYQRAVAAGAEVVEEPVDQDYGVREWGAVDPEQHLWFFHGPLAGPTAG